MSLASVGLGFLLLLWISPALLLVVLYGSAAREWPIPARLERFALAVLSGLASWIRVDAHPSRGQLRLEARRRVLERRCSSAGSSYPQPVLSSLRQVVPVASVLTDQHQPAAPSFMHLEAQLRGPENDIIGERWQVGIN